MGPRQPPQKLLRNQSPGPTKLQSWHHRQQAPGTSAPRPELTQGSCEGHCCLPSTPSPSLTPVYPALASHHSPSCTHATERAEPGTKAMDKWGAGQSYAELQKEKAAGPAAGSKAASSPCNCCSRQVQHLGQEAHRGGHTLCLAQVHPHRKLRAPGPCCHLTVPVPSRPVAEPGGRSGACWLVPLNHMHARSCQEGNKRYAPLLLSQPEGAGQQGLRTTTLPSRTAAPTPQPSLQLLSLCPDL